MADQIDNEHIFSTTDPLGRDIILKQSTWDEHIKDRHGEEGIENIKINLEMPNYITENVGKVTSEYDRNCFFRLINLNSNFYMQKTVVEFKENSSFGEVVTSHVMRKITSNINEGGIIYDSSKNQN